MAYTSDAKGNSWSCEIRLKSGLTCTSLWRNVGLGAQLLALL